MSDQFIGEIRPFAGNYAPVGWLLCDGSLYNVSDYAALDAIVGTIYGGQTGKTFAVPNLSDRAPVHPTGTIPYVVGATGGKETVTLTTKELPKHTHTLTGATSRAGSLNSPINNTFDNSNEANIYSTETSDLETMSESMVEAVGEGGAHYNMSPYVAINFIIAYDGIFPARN